VSLGITVTKEPIVIQCQDEEFQCYDGVKCLPWSFRCDRIAHCYDNSDEAGCDSRALFINCSRVVSQLFIILLIRSSTLSTQSPVYLFKHKLHPIGPAL
jgi:hypothetical protein